MIEEQENLRKKTVSDRKERGIERKEHPYTEKKGKKAGIRRVEEGREIVRV